jgi:fumarate reductase iron-sulfur subunit
MHRLRRVLCGLRRRFLETLVKDERDAGRIERLRAVAGDAGCHSCHTHMSCTERCPKKLSPTAGIAGLKREVFKSTLRGEL